MEAKVGMFWEDDTSDGAIWKTAFSLGSLVVKEMFLPYRTGPLRDYNAYSVCLSCVGSLECLNRKRVDCQSLC